MEENVPKQATEPILTPEKTKKKSPVLTIIFAILALAGIGFGVYGMCFNKPAEKECIESEVADKDEPEEGIENEEDYTIYYELINKYLGSKPLLDDVHNEQYMIERAIANNDLTQNIDGIDVISGDRLKAAIKELFGIDYQDKNEKIALDTPLCWTLEKSKKFQSYYEYSGGCGYWVRSKYNITNTSEDDGQLAIELVLAHENFGIGSISLESNGETFAEELYYVESEPNETSQTEDEANQKINETFDQNQEKMEKYKLIFKKTDRHYYLESGEKLN